jgi:flagellar hook-associated protein 1 FlgK
MGISNLYNIGTSGVMAQRLAIDVTGQNIANVNTDGYSRQKVVLEEESGSVTGGYSLGNGVKVAAIQRSYDTLLQQQLVNGGSSLQQSTVEQSALQRIEPLFNEIGADGLGKAISDYFNSWQDLSINPTGAAERQAVFTRGQILTDTFHQVSSGLQATVDVANSSLAEITASVTDIAANIARLNGMITTTEQLGNNSSANELRDQRDLLVQQLGEKAGITYYENRDGTVDVKLAGYDLVAGQRSAAVYNFPPNSSQPGDIYISPVGSPPKNSGANPPDALIYSRANVATNTNQLSFLGELGGTLHVRDVTIPEIQTKVDAIANKLVTDINAAHRSGFYFAGGVAVAGGDFFDATKLTAANISLDGTLSTTTIAAGNDFADPPANTTPLTSAPGNNSNAKYIASLQSSSIGNSYTSLVSEIGVRVQNAESVAKNNANFMRQISTLRESNSGVSLDEELTNLVKYQKAFEGSAKLINTATEMLDVILGLIR